MNSQHLRRNRSVAGQHSRMAARQRIATVRRDKFQGAGGDRQEMTSAPARGPLARAPVTRAGRIRRVPRYHFSGFSLTSRLWKTLMTASVTLLAGFVRDCRLACRNRPAKLVRGGLATTRVSPDIFVVTDTACRRKTCYQRGLTSPDRNEAVLSSRNH